MKSERARKTFPGSLVQKKKPDVNHSLSDILVKKYVLVTLRSFVMYIGYNSI